MCNGFQRGKCEGENEFGFVVRLSNETIVTQNTIFNLITNRDVTYQPAIDRTMFFFSCMIDSNDTYSQFRNETTPED